MLDELAADAPGMVVSRVRAALIFQAIHADDVAAAIWTVIDARAPGAFNAAPIRAPDAR